MKLKLWLLTRFCRELLLLLLAASCLQLFAQSNWTGPPVSVAGWDLLSPRVSPSALTATPPPRLQPLF